MGDRASLKHWPQKPDGSYGSIGEGPFDDDEGAGGATAVDGPAEDSPDLPGEIGDAPPSEEIASDSPVDAEDET